MKTVKTTLKKTNGRFEMFSHPEGRLLGYAIARRATKAELKASDIDTTKGTYVEVFDANGSRLGHSVSGNRGRDAANTALTFYLIHR